MTGVQTCALPIYIRRGQAGGRDLVKQGLKQMMVGTVNQSHLGAGMVEMLAERQAAKACTQDNNMWACIFRHAVLCIQMGRNAIQPAVMRPKGTCRYKGCTTVVQRMYKGATRSQPRSNPVATPEQPRSNALATRCPVAWPRRHGLDPQADARLFRLEHKFGWLCTNRAGYGVYASKNSL